MIEKISNLVPSTNSNRLRTRKAEGRSRTDYAPKESLSEIAVPAAGWISTTIALILLTNSESIQRGSELLSHGVWVLDYTATLVGLYFRQWTNSFYSSYSREKTYKRKKAKGRPFNGFKPATHEKARMQPWTDCAPQISGERNRYANCWRISMQLAEILLLARSPN